MNSKIKGNVIIFWSGKVYTVDMNSFESRAVKFQVVAKCKIKGIGLID